MIRRRGMRDVHASRPGHVTAGAVIVFAPFQPVARRKATASVGMTFQTTISVIGHLRRGRGKLVWIMARDAPEATLTGAETFTGIHLFKLADKTVLGLVGRPHEHRPEARKRQPGTIVLILPTRPYDPLFTGQVALRRRHHEAPVPGGSG